MKGSITRGVDGAELRVTNSGEAPAFVTIVGLFPDRKSAVTSYTSGSSFLVAAPNRDTIFQHLDPGLAGTTVGIVVLSNVPAGEATRLSLPKEGTPGQATEIAEQLRRALATLNIRADTRVVAFTEKPN